MNVSVIIPVYNEESMIDACLASMAEQSKPFHEIIVVDNNSSDSTVLIAQKYKKVIVLSEKKQGQVHAMRLGFEKSTGDVLVRIDADTRFPPEWNQKLIEFFNTHPNAEAVTGPAEFYDMPKAHLNSKAHRLWYYALLKPILGTHPFLGGNMAMKKSLWEKLKKYPILENSQGHEDIYYSLLAHNEGAQIALEPELWAHISGRTFRKDGVYWEYFIKTLKTLKFGKTV